MLPVTSELRLKKELSNQTQNSNTIGYESLAMMRRELARITKDTPQSFTLCENSLTFKFRRCAMASVEIFLANGFKTRDNSVGTVTRYRVDGPGIKSRWRRDFPTLRFTQPPVQMGTGSFPGLKRPGRGVDNLPLSSVKVKERVVLYL